MEIATRQQRLVYNTDSPNLTMFFSEENRNNIHNSIVKKVYDSTSGRLAISRQSDSELHALMASMADARKDVATLNKQVIDKSVNIILNNISMHLRSMRDLSGTPQPVVNPPQSTRSYKSSNQRTIF